MNISVWLPYAAATLALFVVIAVPRLRADRVAHPVGFLVSRAAVLAVMGLTLALLTDAAAEGDGLTGIDRPVWSWLVAHRSGMLTTSATWVSDVGSTGVMAGIAVLTAAILALRYHRRFDATLIMAVTAGAGLIVVVAKPIVGRVRPPEAFRLVTETNQSFPSGHAVASAAVIGALAAVLTPFLQRRWQQRSIGVLAVLAVLAIGVSRLYLGVHWPTDVIGGWLAGAGWLLLCLTVYSWWRRRPSSRASVAPAVPATRGTSRGIDARRADEIAAA